MIQEDDQTDETGARTVLIKGKLDFIKGWNPFRKPKIVENKFQGEVLKKEIKDFVSKMQDVVSSIDTSKSKYDINSVEVKASVSAGGTLGFMGTGVNLTGTGGITFVFTRKP